MMPMPANPSMGGGPGPGVPVGPGPGAAPGGESPDAIKGQLVMLLKKAKEMAEANGVNFSDVLAEVEGNSVKSDVPLPRPPGGGMPGPV
jgi:hypothetical protein